MATRTGMTPLVDYLRMHGEASETDSFHGVTYWTNDQLQDILDQNSIGYQHIPLVKLGDYDNVSYTFHLSMPYWVEDGFSVYVRDTTTEETTTYTYNHFTHEVTFTSDVSDRDLVAFAKVYSMTDALADLWNAKAQHRKDYHVFKAGVHRMELDQIYQHCVRQSQYWRNQRIRSFRRRSNRFVSYVN